VSSANWKTMSCGPSATINSISSFETQLLLYTPADSETLRLLHKMVFVFRIILRINSDYIPNSIDWMVLVMETQCLLQGRDSFLVFRL
jgi:hypothetical protein